MALPSSGPLYVSDVQEEIGQVPGSPVYFGESPIAQPGSLFGDATGSGGPLNKTAPHYLLDFYGYNQVDDFVMSDVAYPSAAEAAEDEELGVTLWHEGSGSEPEVGDKIWNEATSATVFAGGQNWYRIPASGNVVKINDAGVVMQKEDGNQTFSFTVFPSVMDNTAQTVNVNIISNTAWTISDIVGWISGGRSGSGNDTVTLNIAQNTTGSPRNADISGTYGLGTINANIEQLSTGFFTLNLGYDAASGPAACSASPSNVKADTNNLSTATILRNALTNNPAPAGWYSDGSARKEWNGTSFVTTELCI